MKKIKRKNNRENVSSCREIDSVLNFSLWFHEKSQDIDLCLYTYVCVV